MEKTQNFRVRHGTNLRPDSKFCPECGARILGRNPEQVEEGKQAVRDVMRYRLNWAVALS